MKYGVLWKKNTETTTINIDYEFTSKIYSPLSSETYTNCIIINDSMKYFNDNNYGSIYFNLLEPAFWTINGDIE